jgi:transcriptional regulator of NAD metabolism
VGDLSNKNNKILGEERRQLILEWLMERNEPLTGSQLAKKTNVSRQVIVQDISLLKARNYPIVATAQGYVFISERQTGGKQQCVIACQHKPEETEDELLTIVDFGVELKDVTVEHPVYGDLTAALMISNRYQVEAFITKIKKTDASFLLELTDGIHLHTLEANTTQQLEQACAVLKDKGYLLSNNSNQYNI